MSAPLSPAARTSTSNSRAPGAGSGCSRHSRSPSITVTARMRVTLPSLAVEERADLVVLDEDGEDVVLDAADASALFAMTGNLDAATVSACPTCRSRVVACLAFVDLLDDAAPHPRASELIELADDAPTLHLYVRDVATKCRHRGWLDPGRDEWVDVVRRVRRPRH